ncbi:MAG: DUF2937 family protein [Pseudomonadota bacterium]
MARLLAFILGILGGVGSSQAPEFTQQYLQNLTGRVAALTDVVARFDEDAARSDMSRDQALQVCLADDRPNGTMSCLGRAEDVAQYERLSMQLSTLEATDDWQRPIYLARDYDPDVLASTKEKFQPAVPTTLVGGGYAAAGFAVLWGISAMIFGLIGGLFGRDRY